MLALHIVVMFCHVLSCFVMFCPVSCRTELFRLVQLVGVAVHLCTIDDLLQEAICYYCTTRARTKKNGPAVGTKPTDRTIVSSRAILVLIAKQLMPYVDDYGAGAQEFDCKLQGAHLIHSPPLLVAGCSDL